MPPVYIYMLSFDTAPQPQIIRFCQTLWWVVMLSLLLSVCLACFLGSVEGSLESYIQGEGFARALSLVLCIIVVAS